jgi:hypothetical protein
VREVKLPSGAVLKVNSAPFGVSKELYKSILSESKQIEFSSTTDFAQVFKDLFCSGFSSDRVEAAMWKCMERCLYNDLKIVPDTFEPVEAREDFVPVCMEVGKENLFPFMKNLFAVYEEISMKKGTDQK